MFAIEYCLRHYIKEANCPYKSISYYRVCLHRCLDKTAVLAKAKLYIYGLFVQFYLHTLNWTSTLAWLSFFMLALQAFSPGNSYNQNLPFLPCKGAREPG